MGTMGDAFADAAKRSEAVKAAAAHDDEVCRIRGGDQRLEWRSLVDDRLGILPDNGGRVAELAAEADHECDARVEAFAEYLGYVDGAHGLGRAVDSGNDPLGMSFRPTVASREEDGAWRLAEEYRADSASHEAGRSGMAVTPDDEERRVVSA